VSVQLSLAKKGVNVLTTTDVNSLIFTGRFNSLKIIRAETKLGLNVNADSVNFTYPHGLGYTPAVFGIAKFDDGYACLPEDKARNTSALKWWRLTADSNNIVIEGHRGTEANYTFDVTFYIFESPANI
jgi:hypothetical protein